MSATILATSERQDIAAAIKDSFYEARDGGRTMHQAAEDSRIFAAVEVIIADRMKRVLLDQAEEFRTSAAAAWGGDAGWLTTGRKVADLVAEWCVESANEIGGAR